MSNTAIIPHQDLMEDFIFVVQAIPYYCPISSANFFLILGCAQLLWMHVTPLVIVSSRIP